MSTDLEHLRQFVEELSINGITINISIKDGIGHLESNLGNQTKPNRFNVLIDNILLESINKEVLRLQKVEKLYEVSQIKALLTSTEMTVLDLISKGYTQHQISEKLFISIRTTKNHVSNILRKTGMKSSKEVAKKLKMLKII